MALKGIFTPEEPRSGCLVGEEDEIRVFWASTLTVAASGWSFRMAVERVRGDYRRLEARSRLPTGFCAYMTTPLGRLRTG
jgi:hypothetical protein